MNHRLEPGTRIGVFEVLEPLGSGGMGEVYRARDTSLGRDVALKTLPASLAAQPSRLARLRKEARTLAALSHPHIATLFGLEERNGATALVMEVVEGRTLADRLRLHPLSVREALELGRQIAAGLEAAHEKGILHRDLKPANIVIDPRGQVKLLDFGLAISREDDLAGSHDSTSSAAPGEAPVAGTAPYMSPEQARGEPLDKRSDVWAFGCVLFEMLAGRRAFHGVSWAETMAAVLEREPDWAAVPGATPPGARRLLERCLHKDRERRLRDIGDARLELEELLAPERRTRRRRDDESPYPGLAPFTERDADDFFGREGDIEALWTKLRARTLLAVIGPSGAGKTSFVRAGIVASRPDDWAAVVATPGDAPMRRLGEALAPSLAGDPDALPYLVRFEDPQSAFEALVRWRKRHAEALLVIDQFEEVFTLSAPDVQARFAGLLGRLATEAGVHVLLSLRDDFLMACQRCDALAGVFADLTPLGPPTAQGLQRALVEPAVRRGYRFEDAALVDEVVAAVEGERGALPLVAFAAARLWERRDSGTRVLTRAAYEEIGGVSGALARHAEATLERIGSQRHAQVREVFRNLVTAQGTRASAERVELLSLFQDRAVGEGVLDALIDARLLTSYEVTADGVARRQQVEIAHESLLSAWPRLVRWQTQDADSAQLREQLRQAARAWEDRGRQNDLLWSGTAFREYQVWRERYAGALTGLEESFVTAMTAQATRRRRRRRLAVATLIALLAAGLTVVGVLWRRSQQEVRRAESAVLRAEAARLVALGRLVLENYPTAAVAYATRSLELSDTPEARRFAVEALWRGPTAFIVPLPTGTYLNIDFSPDGRWLAAGSLGDRVLVWPSSGGDPIVLGGHELTGSNRLVEFGPASDVLVTKTVQRDPLRIWSIPGGKLLQKIDFDSGGRGFFELRGDRLVTFELRERPSTSTTGADIPAGPPWVHLLRHRPVRGGPVTDMGQLSLTPPAHVDESGKWLALMRGPRLMVRSLDGRFERTDETLVGTHPERVANVVFGPGGRLLSRNERGELRIWSLANHAAMPRVLQGPVSADWEQFDSTGSWLAQSVGNAVRLWDLAAPRETTPQELRRNDVLAFRQTDFTMASGQWIAASNETSLSLWPLARRYARTLTGHTNTIRSVVFAPDASWVATTSHDSTVRIWPLRADTPDGHRIAAKEPKGRPGWGLSVDPSGRHLLAPFPSPESVMIIDVTGKRPPRMLDQAHVGGPVANAISGRLAAVGANYAAVPEEMVIRVWDTDSGRLLKSLQAPDVGTAGARHHAQGGVMSLAFAPDGQLYSGGWGGVRKWDVDRGTSELVVQGKYMTLTLSQDGRYLLAATRPGPNLTQFPSVASFHDLEHHTSQSLRTHGSTVISLGLDPAGRIAVTGSADGIVRVGSVSGGEPHLLYGHQGWVRSVAVSPDGRWIASGGQDGILRLWPMPDVSKAPLHTLPHDALLARLKSLTNLRVVGDDKEATGYRLDVGPFPGWQKAPTW